MADIISGVPINLSLTWQIYRKREVFMNQQTKEYLEGQFGSRANFNEMERVLYSHDIAAIPSLIAPLIGKTVPDAIVQPQNEEELVNLINWAG